jgi:hypothetical protein
MATIKPLNFTVSLSQETGKQPYVTEIQSFWALIRIYLRDSWPWKAHQRGFVFLLKPLFTESYDDWVSADGFDTNKPTNNPGMGIALEEEPMSRRGRLVEGRRAMVVEVGDNYDLPSTERMRTP